MPDLPVPDYRNDFPSAVARITEVVERWVYGQPEDVLDIDQFEEMVFIKQSTHLISHANAAFQRFAGIKSPNGQPIVNTFLDVATMGIAVKSDELLFSSAQSIEVDYVSTRGDLGTFQLRTHKRWLSPNSRNVSILGITRILGRLEPARSAAEHVAALAKKFELLDEDSQALCRLMAAGQTQREIAELLHCTTRTIENRRNRIMVELGVSKPIDIVKFMVRLAEHGFISPDF